MTSEDLVHVIGPIHNRVSLEDAESKANIHGKGFITTDPACLYSHQAPDGSKWSELINAKYHDLTEVEQQDGLWHPIIMDGQFFLLSSDPERKYCSVLDLHPRHGMLIALPHSGLPWHAMQKIKSQLPLD